jgi:hypothetical protein
MTRSAAVFFPPPIGAGQKHVVIRTALASGGRWGMFRRSDNAERSNHRLRRPLVEPPDLWERYIDGGLRAKAPRLVADRNGDTRIALEGRLSPECSAAAAQRRFWPVALPRPEPRVRRSRAIVAAHRIVELRTKDGLSAYVNSSSSCFTSFRSAVSKPSVNEP